MKSLRTGFNSNKQPKASKQTNKRICDCLLTHSVCLWVFGRRDKQQNPEALGSCPVRCSFGQGKLNLCCLSCLLHLYPKLKLACKVVSTSCCFNLRIRMCSRQAQVVAQPLPDLLSFLQPPSPHQSKSSCSSTQGLEDWGNSIFGGAWYMTWLNSVCISSL